MKLSIVVPSNRTTMRIQARLLQICSLAGEDVEVVIRDNSNDPGKAEFLSKISMENCRCVMVPPCSIVENFNESLKLARGEFVILAADDDFVGEKAVVAIVQKINDVAGDQTVVGITGDYVSEELDRTTLIKYPPLDSLSVEERIRNFVDVRRNMVVYSALRTRLCQEALDFVSNMPFDFVYRDWMYVLIMLMSGRWANIGRAICYYDFSGWGTPGAYFMRTLPAFTSVGIDPSIVHFQELLPALEGCLLAQSPLFNREASKEARSAVTRMWYARWHHQFATVQAPRIGSAAEKIAIGLREKWLRKTDVSFSELLDDISDFMSIHNPKTGAVYKAYWSFFLVN